MLSQQSRGFGVREILGPALELLESPDTWVRAGAAAALGILGSEEAVPLLAACIQDKEVWVRREAVIALLRIDSPEAIPALQKALEDEDWEVRLCAAAAARSLRPLLLAGFGMTGSRETMRA